MTNQAGEMKPTVVYVFEPPKEDDDESRRVVKLEITREGMPLPDPRISHLEHALKLLEWTEQDRADEYTDRIRSASEDLRAVLDGIRRQ